MVDFLTHQLNGNQYLPDVTAWLILLSVLQESMEMEDNLDFPLT